MVCTALKYVLCAAGGCAFERRRHGSRVTALQREIIAVGAGLRRNSRHLYGRNGHCCAPLQFTLRLTLGLTLGLTLRLAPRLGL